MPKPWHRQDVVAAVKKRGSNMAALAVAHGYHRGTLLRSTYRRYPRAHALIAEFLGVSRHTIWPQFYGPDDRPLPVQRTAKRGAAR